MPTRTTGKPPKVPIQPNPLHEEELDEPCEVPDKQMKQQQLELSPRPSTSSNDGLPHDSLPTPPYKPYDFVRNRPASPLHTNGDINIFLPTYRTDAPQFESIKINVLVHGRGVLTLRTYPDDTIDFLKLQIETRAWIPAERQRLSYNGTFLEYDSFQLSMYEIIDQSRIICHEA
ncbi:hypothetical protein MMC31_001653 [Peltigera leucophlebia]|nr:hypothetical protein [Peltigera leucophlebia]